MKQLFTRAAALAVCAALGLALTACGEDAGSASTASSAASSAAATQATFGSYTEFDYESFDYSQSQDANGYWEDVTAAELVTLPEDFAAVPMTSADVTPTDQDVQDYLDQLLAATSTTQQVTDRAAVDGDTVNIDYLGTVDGVAFTGGEAAGFDLTLGSGSFIGANGSNKGFEEQLVGHTPGETFDITVTFPEGYRDSTDAEGNAIVMSGTEAVFTITMNYITETVVPELTDEWVQANLTEYYAITKAEEVEPLLREELLFQNQAEYIYSYLMENAVFAEIPDVVLNYEVCACLDYYAGYAAYYSQDLASFVTETIGLGSIDELLVESEETIRLYCKEDLLYQALAEKLGVTVTEEDMAPYAGYVDYYGQNYVTRQAMIDKVMETLVASAVVTE